MNLFAREPIIVAPGAFFVPDWLPLERQCELIALCREWGKPPAGFHVPCMSSGAPLSIRSVCLGWHWRAEGYRRFVDERGIVPAKPFPVILRELAQQAYRQTFADELPYLPDAAIVNWYDAQAVLGMHQDRSETAETLASGRPVVTISIGDAAVFRFGNSETRNKPYRDVTLQSGDLFVFGGTSRLAYHGIVKILPRTAPAALGAFPGRLSITVRQTGLTPDGRE